MEIEKKEVEEIIEPVETVVEPVVEEKPKKKKMIIGKVIGGTLKMREEPTSDADVLLTLKNDEAVIVDMDASTDTFYKVTANGLTGYCVRNFIAI